MSVEQRKAAEHFNALGLDSAGKGDHSAAIRHYHQGLKWWDKCPYIHNNLGSSLQGTKKTTAALHHVRFAVELSPFDPKYQMNLARLLDSVGQLPEAVEHYKIAATYDPSRRAECKRRLALAYVSMREVDKAYEVYKIRDVKMPKAILRQQAADEAEKKSSTDVKGAQKYT